MKINQGQISLPHSVSDASIFKIKVGDLKKEIMTLQTLMVQLKEKLGQPNYWSLAENGNMFFDCRWTFSYEKKWNAI